MKGLKLYKSYSFRDKDPIIDAMRTAIADTGDSLAKVSERSGVSAGTMGNWFNGRTRRPQFATVAAFCVSQDKHAVIFGKNGPRLIGRAVPSEHRAHTGKESKRRRTV
jgi:transcriptional regulator with XRE-family HTH domain